MKIASYSIEKVGGEGSFETSTVTATVNANGSASTNATGEGIYAVFSLFAYASGNGTLRTAIFGETIQVNNGTANINFDIGYLMALEKAEIIYGVSVDNAVKQGTASSGFLWYLFNVNGTNLYAIDFGDTEYTMDDVPTVGVTFYNASGNAIAYNEKSTGYKAPASSEKTYFKVVMRNEASVDVDLESRYFASGDTVEFTIIPREGYYLGDSIQVTAATHYSTSDKTYRSYDVTSLGNNRYSVSNVTSNLYITVTGGVIPITYSVTYDLENMTSLSQTSTVYYGGGLKSTLMPGQDCIVMDVTVTMGGRVVPGAYDSSTGVVQISEVTGDVVISATAVPWYVFDDGDDYVPPTNVIEEPEKDDDDSVTLIACAAAAVVAAIMAVFLIMDRKS